MVGRTPEYLGKKIESFDVKMAVLAILVTSLTILIFSAIAVISKFGSVGHHQSRSARSFADFVRVHVGSGQQRFGVRRAKLEYALVQHQPGHRDAAGPLLHDDSDPGDCGKPGARRNTCPNRREHFPVTGPLFTVLLVSVILIVGALTFFPALSLGPILEHLLMDAGKAF